MVGKNNPAKRPEVRKKLSDFITENNPMKHEEYRNKVKQYMLNNHPMKGKTYEELYGIEKAAKLKEIRRQQMLNGQAGEMCRSMPSTTKPQLKLYEIIKKLYPNTLIELEFPMNNYTLDIAIPYYKIDIEYDCSYWHTKIKDDRRDNYMLTMGWNVLRIIDNIPDNDTIYNKIEKIKTDAQAKQCAITFADSVS